MVFIFFFYKSSQILRNFFHLCRSLPRHLHIRVTLHQTCVVKHFILFDKIRYLRYSFSLCPTIDRAFLCTYFFSHFLHPVQVYVSIDYMPSIYHFMYPDRADLSVHFPQCTQRSSLNITEYPLSRLSGFEHHLHLSGQTRKIL